MVCNERWLTDFRHRIVGERAEITGQQRKSVCGMPEQIAFEQNFRDVAGAILRQTSRRQQGMREVAQAVRRIQSRSGRRRGTWVHSGSGIPDWAFVQDACKPFRRHVKLVESLND